MEAQFIKTTIERILESLSVNARFKGVAEMSGGDIIKFAVESEEPHFLIGEDGKVLLAFNHIVKRIFEQESARKSFRPLNFIVDVNDYQEKHMQDLKNKAQIMAERARFFKSNVELSPMNPYERMIVHSYFSEVPDIETESMGFGRERRVVIKYRAV